MATPTRRRRRGAESPTSLIVNFFMDAPLAEASAALDLAQVLMVRRLSKRVEALPVAGKLMPTMTPPASRPAPTPPALAQEAAPAPIPTTAVSGPGRPRQRAKRSDAGKPRKQAAAVAATPAAPATTRRRPAIAEAPSAPLPDLPPQDVPYEAREIDVDLPLEN
jgi:hypothetical protein